MKLTLTEKQIPDARETLGWIRIGAPPSLLTSSRLPGCAERTPGSRDFPHLLAWADALEAAITEAEGTQAPAKGPVSDADERAFWRAVFTAVHSVDKRDPTTAADQADEALARYRKAFGGES